MKPGQKSNIELISLIRSLQRQSSEQNVRIWKRIADDLGKSTRRQRVVNLVTLAESTKENEIVIIPGKLLGNGELKHKLTIAAWKVSASAKDKLSTSGAKLITIPDLMNENPKGNKVRIIG